MAGSEKQGVMKYVHIAIALFLMFVAGNIIPPVYPLTQVGMQVAGVFAGVVWSWIFIGFLWPSLLALVALGMTDLMSMNAVISGSFGNHVAVLLLFSMILFGSPEHVGATKYITRFFLTRKIYNGKPIVFAFIFFFATYMLSVAVNVTPALLLMWAVLYGILNDLGYKKGDKFTSLMIVGTFLGAISGQASLPFSGSTLAIISVFNDSVYEITGAAGSIPAPQYILLGFIFTLLVFIGFCLFMKVVCKPADLANVANVNTEMFAKDALPPMNAIQKINFGAMIAFILLLLAPEFLPDAWWITATLRSGSGLGPAGTGLLITGVMMIIRVNGQPALDFGVVAKNHINWDVYVMVAAAMVVASALTNAETGVVAAMEQALQPLLGGHTAFMFFAIMLIFGMTVTSFASSMVIGIALMPILVIFGMQASANLQAVASTTILLIHYSIILPSASVFAAMLWGNEEWISAKDVFKSGAFIVVLAFVIAFVVIMPLSNLLF
jgi:sodium-dependent dicarboxylate transporter 2/3/5